MEQIIGASPGDLADFEAFLQEQLSGRSGDERHELECYLRAHPGEDIRDWKGKCDRWHLSPAEPDEVPWDRLNRAEARAIAARSLARRLPRNVRQAAARDAQLIWNQLARRYRLRRPGDFDPEGGENVSDTSRTRPAAARNKNANTHFPGADHA